MQENEYKTLYELEDYYWWYVGRRRIIGNILSLTMKKPSALTVDYGCGTGSNLPLLRRFGPKVIGLDIAPQSIDYCRKRGEDQVFLIQSPEDLKSRCGNGADLITLLDVLEHIEDDAGMIRSLKSSLAPGGLLLLTVPAYQFLWSGHDIALHHKRRYTLSGIRRKLEAAGFRVEKATYAISFMFPIIAFYRMANMIVRSTDISDPKSSHVILPPKLNRFIIALLYLEAWLCRYVKFPFGTSVIVAAKNPDIGTAS
ncbi:MAG: class I SAM-dependent methyltransferase [Candidatus Saccharibacteria bacterium]